MNERVNERIESYLGSCCSLVCFVSVAGRILWSIYRIPNCNITITSLIDCTNVVCTREDFVFNFCIAIYANQCCGCILRRDDSFMKLKYIYYEHVYYTKILRHRLKYRLSCKPSHKCNVATQSVSACLT